MVFQILNNIRKDNVITGIEADSTIIARLHAASGQCFPLVGMIANKAVIPAEGRAM